jgi:hypothetical protein
MLHQLFTAAMCRFTYEATNSPSSCIDTSDAVNVLISSARSKVAGHLLLFERNQHKVKIKGV